jgi:hypothetical protein
MILIAAAVLIAFLWLASQSRPRVTDPITAINIAREHWLTAWPDDWDTQIEFSANQWSAEDGAYWVDLYTADRAMSLIISANGAARRI